MEDYNFEKQKITQEITQEYNLKIKAIQEECNIKIQNKKEEIKQKYTLLLRNLRENVYNIIEM